MARQKIFALQPQANEIPAKVLWHPGSLTGDWRGVLKHQLETTLNNRTETKL
jgi:hypothetical protein